MGGLLDELSAAETLSFSTDVSDTSWQRKRRKLRKTGTLDRVVSSIACSPCILMRKSHRFQARQCLHPETCVLTQELFVTRAASCRGVQKHTGVTTTAAELRHKPRVMLQQSFRAGCRREGHGRSRDHVSNDMAPIHKFSQPQRRSSVSRNASVSRCKH